MVRKTRVRQDREPGYRVILYFVPSGEPTVEKRKMIEAELSSFLRRIFRECTVDWGKIFLPGIGAKWLEAWIQTNADDFQTVITKVDGLAIVESFSIQNLNVSLDGVNVIDLARGETLHSHTYPAFRYLRGSVWAAVASKFAKKTLARPISRL